MRSDLCSRRMPSLILLLALGCGDSAADEGDDEAGSTTAGEETSADGNDNVEAGSEGNTSTTNGESETGSSSESGESETDDVDTDDAETADLPETADTPDTDTDSTETGEPPPNCPMLDEQACNAADNCASYLGSPYEVTGDGTICLGSPEWIGCYFAEMACLPATGTLCEGDQAYHVDNLCPAPEGFAPCEPPVDPVLPCMP